MSGIAGLYYLDGRPAEAGTVQAMLESISHRGPDSSGMWTNGPISLGHRMLWTTPESLHEKLPLVCESGNIVLTADARIDNRAELLSLLGNGRPAGEVADSELIAQAYVKWGESCPERLIGDFAFVIWDARSRTLFCARDPMGVKPLYYYYGSNLFAFGSEVKALLALRDIPRRLNEERVAELLALNWEDCEGTFYEDICRLPAATYALVGAAGIKKQRYWSLDPKRELHLPSEQAYAEAMREVFTEAVRCRLRSAFPVGSMLSGGLDSSSIVCTARQILTEEGRGPLHTFSDIFPDLAERFPRIDERPWIQAVVSPGGLEPHYINADGLNPLDALLWSEDEPLPVPNNYISWFAFKEARRARVRVVLNGHDGDTVVSYGTGYLADLARSFKCVTLLSEARALATRRGMPLRRVLWSDGLKYLCPPSVRRAYWKLRQYSPAFVPFAIPINPVFAKRIGLAQRIRTLEGDPAALPRTAREGHCESLQDGLLMFSTELYDKAAAVHSLEPRLPFLDRRLVEFCLALPTSQKLHQGWNRFVLRRAMDGVLPPQVQWRTDKGNLGPNIDQGLFERNHDLLEKVALRNPQVIGEYMDLDGLRKAYKRYESRPTRPWADDVFTILIAVTLSHWLQTSGFCAQDSNNLPDKSGKRPV